MQATNQSVQRSFNRSLVLQKLRQERRISRVDLSRALGLKKSSISNIVNELIERRLVIPREEGSSSMSGGRKPVFLEINQHFCSFLGIELQPNRFRAVILDLDGNILHRESDRVATHRDGFVQTLQDIYSRLTTAVRTLGLPLAAVGVGIPGYVNPYSGVVFESIPHGLHNADMSEVSNPWGVPVFIENDANCCAWAELLRSREHQDSDFLAILMEFQERNPLISQEAGVSLGMGLVINSELYYGQSYNVGEFHSLFWKSGNKSQTGIADEQLVDIRNETETFDAFLEEVLLNLTPIASVIAPQRVLLCGDAARALPRMKELLSARLTHTWFAKPSNAQLLATSVYEDEVVAVGAAGRLIVSLFNARSLSKSASVPGLDWDHILRSFGASPSDARGIGAA